MEANGQTLYNDDLLNILPDGVIILDINRESHTTESASSYGTSCTFVSQCDDASSDQQDIQAVK